MRRNYTFDAVFVEDRNSLIDAVNNKEQLIIIQGSLKEEIKKEILPSKINGFNSGMTSGLLAATAVVSLSVPALIGAAVFGGIKKLVDKENFSSYAFFYIINGKTGITGIGMVKPSRYNEKLDKVHITANGTEGFTENMNIKLFRRNKCPVCGAKLNKKVLFMKCDCGNTLARIVHK